MKLTWFLILGFLLVLIAIPAPSYADEVADDEDADDEPEEAAAAAEEKEEEEDDDDEEPSPYSDLFPPPHGAVKTTLLFPDHPENRFTTGSKINVLLGFANTGNIPLTVTDLRGAIHSPFDFSFFLQNFTGSSPNLVVGPGEEATFGYLLHPDAGFEPRDYLLSLHVYYHDNSQRFSNTYFNSTVDLVESPWAAGSRQAFTYTIVAAVVVVGLYIAVNAFGGKKIKRTVAKATSRGPSATPATVNERGVDEDWLPAGLTKKESSPRRTARK